MPSSQVARTTPRPSGDAVGFPENALDIVDGNPVDLGDLGSRHADLTQLRTRGKCDRGTSRVVCAGDDRCFDLRKRFGADGEIPHTRFPRRWSAGGEPENQLLGDLTFRGEQRLGRLTRSLSVRGHRHDGAVVG